MQFYYNKIIVSFTLIFSIIIFSFTACSTGPVSEQNNFPGIIAEEGNLLIHFNLSKDSILLNQFINRYSNEDFSKILDKTEKLTISVNDLGVNANYSIITEGKYPRTFSNLFIGREKNWEKHKDNYIWWENKVEGMYISVPIKSLVIISNSNFKQELSFIESGSRKYIPQNVQMEFDQTAVTIYSRLPGSNFYQSFNIPSEKMSIQELFFVIRKNDDNYKISGVLEFLNESDAKVFSTALRLGLLIKLRESGNISVMKIVNNCRINTVQNSIIIDNILLNLEEMINLMTVGTNSL